MSATHAGRYRQKNPNLRRIPPDWTPESKSFEQWLDELAEQGWVPALAHALDTTIEGQVHQRWAMISFAYRPAQERSEKPAS